MVFVRIARTRNVYSRNGKLRIRIIKAVSQRIIRSLFPDTLKQDVERAGKEITKDKLMKLADMEKIEFDVQQDLLQLYKR